MIENKTMFKREEKKMKKFKNNKVSLKPEKAKLYRKIKKRKIKQGQTVHKTATGRQRNFPLVTTCKSLKINKDSFTTLQKCKNSIIEIIEFKI